MNPEKDISFFTTAADFRLWLEKNHDTAKELIVGYYKTGSGIPGMTWSESVDQALCYGWIDGVRKSIDKDRYCIRFTPRKPKSIWSTININKIDALSQQGLMKPEGLAAFNLRQEHRSGIYTYENEEVKLSEDFEILFRSDQQAWLFFQSLPPSYRKPAVNWVMSAKQEATSRKRLEELIRDSRAGKKIKQLSY